MELKEKQIRSVQQLYFNDLLCTVSKPGAIFLLLYKAKVLPKDQRVKVLINYCRHCFAVTLINKTNPSF